MKVFKKFKQVFFVVFLCTVSSIYAQKTNGLSWPREMDIKDLTVTFYEPQLEHFENNILEGRMAVSYMDKNKDMSFGALWFKATLLTDWDERTVTLSALEIPDMAFPSEEDDEQVEKFKKELIQKLENSDIEMTLDGILASLSENIEQVKLAEENLKHAPPVIYFRTSPSVLISIDGEPKEKENKSEQVSYVINTPFFIVRLIDEDDYYLRGDNCWFTSKYIKQGWEATHKVPKKIKQFAKKQIERKDEKQEFEKNKQEDIEIIVSTIPAELIITDGEPKFSPIEGTELLYIQNSESDIIMDIKTQKYYVFISGRWFYAKSLENGTWHFEEPKELPDDFKLIPKNFEKSDVLVGVPGTHEANMALLEHNIPQTATVNRKEAKVEVKYDGKPAFKIIEGTSMKYAINTASSVLWVDGTYYCVDKAIWFKANQAEGPWVVADVRPESVEDIPTDNPVSNIKYVHIYESTPEIVYVGYLPGYMHSYTYGGTVVYGSGYYYNPWYGSYYYPRPCTFGFGVHYDVWTGWGFSWGFSSGWIGWGFHPPYYTGFWGPMGYRRGYRHGYYNRGYNQIRHASRNMYRNRRGVSTRNTHVNTRDKINRDKLLRPSSRENNVLTDRNGMVYQREDRGNWNRVSKDRVSRSKETTRSRIQDRSQRPQRPQPKFERPGVPPSRVNRNSLQHHNFNRTMNTRSRGASSYRNFQSAPNRRGGIRAR